VIFRHFLWCDKWRSQVQRFREGSPLPVLDLDIADAQDPSRQAGRIDSFLEVLAGQVERP
jgi:hypothetical protein